MQYPHPIPKTIKDPTLHQIKQMIKNLSFKSGETSRVVITIEATDSGEVISSYFQLSMGKLASASSRFSNFKYRYTQYMKR